MAEFWVEWGALAYFGAAAWSFFEGETFVLLAAAAGRASCLVNPWMLMIAAWLGSFAGDQLWFSLGRRYGRRAVRRFPGAEKRLAAATGFVERYGDLFVLTYRFAYGIRNVASAACGVAGMSRARFAVLNFVAAGIWSVSFVAAGWYLASWLGTEDVAWVIGVAGLVLVLTMVWKFAQRPAPTPIG